MTLYQFLLILRARWRAIALFVAVALLAALAANLLLPKKYTAQTSLLIDIRAADPTGSAAWGGTLASNYLATQVSIISGDRVAQRVVEILKLDDDPHTKEAWSKATHGRGDFDAWLVTGLKQGLDVRPARDSNVIDIIYRSDNAERAAQLANAFAQAYMDVNLALKTEPAHQYAEWFDERTKAAREKLEAAQSRLSAYQQKAGIVSSDGNVDYENARLAQISSQLTAVQAEVAESQSKRNAGGSTVADVMQSPLINNLKADVARLEGQVQELRVNLGPNNPRRERAEAQLAAARSQLASETARIQSSINTTYQVNRQREHDLQAALAAQKARVLKLNKDRDDLNVYRRDVEAAQREYETVSKSASQTRLESLTTQTNVVRMDSAVAPLLPSSPKSRLNLLIAALAGTMLGVAWAVMLELINRRVRSAEDLTQMLDLPVLGNISSSREPRHLPGPRLLLGHGKSA